CAHRTAPQKGLAARVIAAPLRASFPCVSRSATLLPALKEGLINSPQMRDTIALCRGFIHAADVR
ncbi:hypothetical protein, partial [Xanthomonas citri]|uniref:hypothetical protein n=1 Tax=Xanthomonas citri TaxID=346 RepID=UPI001CA4C4D4